MNLTRRRALQIMAASVAVPLGVLALRSARGLPQPVQWRGEALGAMSAMTLWSHDKARAERAIVRMRAEIDRLEDIFSLYRATSELSRLNADGRVDAPSRDLVHVLDQSQRIAEASGGKFDPTIQPLWTLHSARSAPDLRNLEAALSLVDYTAISAHIQTVRFEQAGMSASLNGIAQGYITDRVTELLGNEGFENAVIELGETRALGQAPDGTPFRVGLLNPHEPNQVMEHVSLAGASLSVSGGYGQSLPDGTGHHIFDPLTGKSANELAQVAVVAPRAMLADALSTAIYVAGERASAAILSTVAGASAILIRPDGSRLQV